MDDSESIPNHQVKVDNWPLFFLQRLHHFYRKKSHCDLTLIFSTLDTIKSVKVHKLVLHACTDYFESLDIMTDSEHGEFLQLSKEMHPDVVIPIISFMYTGKLEFPVSLQPRLYEAATKLRMTILTKLLDVQPTKVISKSAYQSLEKTTINTSSVNNEISLAPSNLADNNQDLGELNVASVDIPNVLQKKLEEPAISMMPVSVLASQQNQNANHNLKPFKSSEVTPSITNDQIKANILKKNVGLQLTSSNPKTKVVVVSLPPTLPGRKLPVWKRKVPLAGSHFITDNVQNVRGTFRPPEKPKLTRFEWEEDLNDPTALKPVEDAFKILSYDGAIKINHPIILDSDGVIQSKDESFDSLKRSSDSSLAESPPHKRSKSDLQDMKEYGKQQQLRNEIICSEENEDDMMDDHDDLYGTCEDESDELTNFNLNNLNSSTPKPILKTVSKPEPLTALKKVRFSLDKKENKESSVENIKDFTVTTASTAITTSVIANVTSASDMTVTKTTPCANQQRSDSDLSKQKIVLPMNMSQIQSGKHHVKIVSEVLKKYPNLAKKENIKLRVVSKNPAAVPPTVQQAVEGDAGGGNKGSSLVSYIFLTNKSSGELLPGKVEPNERDKLFDVENKTGPWFCQVCDEQNPIEFESYYTYRRHLVEVHELKIDARICEYCGLKNSKRNHLLHHLYTKHKIDPPAHVSFPKCSECDYIALSDALLVKHKSTHDPKGLTCYTCNVVFKSYSSLQSHLYSEYHAQKFGQREGKQIYRCPYCEALFGDGEKLGKHIVVLHWGKNAQVSDQKNKEEQFELQSGQQLQYAEEVENTDEVECTENTPSSELESLSNVASEIATSLSLVGNEQTVIYYEQRNEEGQDIGREATVIAGDECKDYMISSQSEELGNRQSKIEGSEELEAITIENEDSNSRLSNAEEINRSSCSDHDYTESANDDQLHHMIPVHPVANQISDGTVIQQIIPDQGLVFANQGNVVFQSPCVSLPPRVLVTSGKVVLPHGDQNVILSQVIQQTPIILSSPIVQQSGNLIEDTSSTIVFANPTVVATTNMTTTTTTTNHLENIQAAMQQYSLTQPQKVLQSIAEQQGVEGEEDEEEEEEEEQEEEEEEEEKVEEIEEEVVKRREVQEEEENEKKLVKEETESVAKENVNLVVDNPSVSFDEQVVVESEGDNMLLENSKIRLETSKIVDDWDETNDGQQNVENRSDGPSRPDFF